MLFRTHVAALLLAASFVVAPDARADSEPGESQLGESEPAESESAIALLARVFENVYAEDYIQTLTLATRSRGGKEMRKRLQITRRQSVRPGKALLRFLDPYKIRRTSVLILENQDRADDLYVYLPAVDFTRHLSASQRADAFFGTDLSYEDVEPKDVEDFTARWASDDATTTEQRRKASEDSCVLVEIAGKPKFDSAYERQVYCIERERAILVWAEIYERGKVTKRMAIDLAEVRQVGDRYIPFLMTVETLAQRSVTRVITEDYDLRAEIPDRLFNTWNLSAGSAKGDRRKTEPAAGGPSDD